MLGAAAAVEFDSLSSALFTSAASGPLGLSRRYSGVLDGGLGILMLLFQRLS